MDTKKAKKWLLVASIWVVILVTLVIVYKRQPPSTGTKPAWEVVKMDINPIFFDRGTARISYRSFEDVDQVADILRSHPEYHLTVIGHASTKGDPVANRQIARDRANAVKKWLVGEEGIKENCIKIEEDGNGPSSGGEGPLQSVTFVVKKRILK